MLRKVILCPNPYRDAQLRVAKEAKRVLDEVGCPNVVCLPFRNQEPPEGYGLNIEPLQQEIRGADMIIAFGGDGTILHLSKTAAHRDIPVLGVNLGSLGFMAELESKDLSRLRDLCDGKYEIESHMMLDVSVQRDGRVIYSNLALNEALIARGNISRVIRLQIFTEQGKLVDVAGDGVIVASPTGSTAYSLSAGATLPLVFAAGYRTRMLSLTAAWNFSNGLVANVGKLTYDEATHSFTNLQHIGYREGLHKLTFGIGYSNSVQLAHRDFITPRGYVLSASYALNPTNDHFSDLISVYGKLYTPGFAPHNSLTAAATYQTSIGGFKNPAGESFLSYKSARLIPRGFDSNDINSRNYFAASLDYQLPVWYPEGGIPSVLYFKRIRLNLGADYGQFDAFDYRKGRTETRRIHSFGGDLYVDFNVFRQPASATSTLRLSFYAPSKGGLWWSASLGLPF